MLIKQAGYYKVKLSNCLRVYADNQISFGNNILLSGVNRKQSHNRVIPDMADFYGLL